MHSSTAAPALPRRSCRLHHISAPRPTRHRDRSQTRVGSEARPPTRPSPRPVVQNKGPPNVSTGPEKFQGELRPQTSISNENSCTREKKKYGHTFHKNGITWTHIHSEFLAASYGPLTMLKTMTQDPLTCSPIIENLILRCLFDRF